MLKHLLTMLFCALALCLVSLSGAQESRADLDAQCLEVASELERTSVYVHELTFSGRQYYWPEELLELIAVYDGGQASRAIYEAQGMTRVYVRYGLRPLRVYMQPRTNLLCAFYTDTRQ